MWEPTRTETFSQKTLPLCERTRVVFISMLFQFRRVNWFHSRRQMVGIPWKGCAKIHGVEIDLWIEPNWTSSADLDTIHLHSADDDSQRDTSLYCVCVLSCARYMYNLQLLFIFHWFGRMHLHAFSRWKHRCSLSFQKCHFFVLKGNICFHHVFCLADVWKDFFLSWLQLFWFWPTSRGLSSVMLKRL